MESVKLQEALKTMRFLHWTLTLMPVFFGLLTVYSIMTNSVDTATEMSQVFLYTSLVGLVLAIPGSIFAFKYYIKSNKTNKIRTIRDALGPFQTGHLIRLALLEIVGFFSVVATLITGYLPILGVLVLSTLAMVSVTPTKFRISEAIGVNIDDLDTEEE